ncbi:hypothetical protein SNEBB_005762 [Seison nebaliae]|nr:hypothetical protein SNEBB_005762 [Seison nebaliae]
MKQSPQNPILISTISHTTVIRKWMVRINSFLKINCIVFVESVNQSENFSTFPKPIIILETVFITTFVQTNFFHFVRYMSKLVLR